MGKGSGSTRSSSSGSPRGFKNGVETFRQRQEALLNDISKYQFNGQDTYGGTIEKIETPYGNAEYEMIPRNMWHDDIWNIKINGEREQLPARGDGAMRYDNEVQDYIRK